MFGHEPNFNPYRWRVHSPAFGPAVPSWIFHHVDIRFHNCCFYQQIRKSEDESSDLDNTTYNYNTIIYTIIYTIDILQLFNMIPYHVLVAGMRGCEASQNIRDIKSVVRTTRCTMCCPPIMFVGLQVWYTRILSKAASYKPTSLQWIKVNNFTGNPLEFGAKNVRVWWISINRFAGEESPRGCSRKGCSAAQPWAKRLNHWRVLTHELI